MNYHHAEAAVSARPHIDREQSSGMPAIALSHMVVSQPLETFLAIETSEGRFPISAQRFVGDALTWSRADGIVEFMDLHGSQSLDGLREEFGGVDGLMVLVFDSLKDLKAAASVSEVAPCDIAFISVHGQSVDDAQAFALGFAESERG